MHEPDTNFGLVANLAKTSLWLHDFVAFMDNYLLLEEEPERT